MLEDNESLEKCLKEFITVNESISYKLREKKEEIEAFQTKCLAAKTVGTSTSTVGTVLTVAAIGFAPFTGGLSLGLAGVGLATGLGGAAVNITTDLVDRSYTKGFMEDIKRLHEQREQATRNLATHMENLSKTIEAAEASGLSTERAMNLALMTTFYPQLGGRVKNQALTPHLASFLSVYLIQIDQVLLKALPTAANALKPALISIGVTPSLALTSLASKSLGVAAKGLAVVGVAFQVIDIVNLIKAWNSKHPSVEAIDGLISQLQTEKQSMKELLEALEKIKLGLTKDWVLDGLGLPPAIVPAKLQLHVIEPALWNFWLEPQDYVQLVKESGLEYRNYEDLCLLTDFFIRYAVAQAFWDGLIQEWDNISNKTGNKTKTKVLIISWLAKIVKKAVEAAKEGKKKNNRRGDHVINNNVLNVYRDITQAFVAQNNLYSRLATMPEGSAVLTDPANPLDSPQVHNRIRNEMIAFCDTNRPPDVNAALYGRTIEALRLACLSHMNELFRMGTINHNQGTRYTNHIQTLVQQMNSFFGGAPIFVDEIARDTWISQGANHRQKYTVACENVKNMFNALYSKLEDWVRDFRRNNP